MEDKLETRWTEEDTLHSYNPYRELFREASARVVRDVFGRYVKSSEGIIEIGSGLGELVKQAFNGQNESEQTYFYYENKRDTYYLFSKGVDGQPFTQDDVFPLDNSTLGNIGYRHP